MTSPRRVLITTLSAALFVIFLIRILIRESHRLRYLRDSLLLLGTEKHYRSPSSQRQIYADSVFPKGNVDSHHSHGHAAATRTAFTHYAKVLALQLGRGLYDYQGSPRTGAISSSRLAFGAKDLAFDPVCDPIKPGDLIAMVDVDYYVDMNSFLASHFNPVLLYTFSPIDVAANSVLDKTYTFNKDHEVEVYVNGGASYRHRLWNYSVDHVLVSNLIQSTLYLVDRRRLNEHYVSVLFTPVKRFIFPFTFLTPKLTCLQRRIVAVGDAIVLKHLGAKSTVSVGRAGHFASTQLPLEEFEQYSALARTSGVKTTLSSLKSFQDTKLEAAMLLEHLRTLTPSRGIVIPPGLAVRHYGYSNVPGEGKVSMKAFMSPFVDAAHAPLRDWHSEKEMVAKRITAVRSQHLSAPNILLREMVEFVEFIRADLVPASYEEVFEKQNRPSQRRILDKASVMGPKSSGAISSFIKAESYTETKDPRGISMIPPYAKMEYSRYMYAIADHLKTFEWYAFGKPPRELAQGVADVCSELDVILTDFSRMDGRISNIARTLEAMILSACFDAHSSLKSSRSFVSKLSDLYRSAGEATVDELYDILGWKDDRMEVLELHRQQYNRRASTSYGFQYSTNFARLSGSPETSVFNTIWSKFVAYITCRKMRMTPRDAWDWPGIYGGDDGITRYLDPKTYTSMATAVGQKLTSTVIKRGDLGVEFLARKYGPNVWNGSTDSCCDIDRQLAKFHVSTVSDTFAGVKLREKATSYILTDENTPIIGAFCRKVIELSSKAPVTRERYWAWSWPEKADQYPNVNGLDWMNDLVVDYDVILFEKWLAGCKSIADLLSPPLLKIPPPVDAKVDRREVSA